MEASILFTNASIVSLTNSCSGWLHKSYSKFVSRHGTEVASFFIMLGGILTLVLVA